MLHFFAIWVPNVHPNGYFPLRTSRHKPLSIHNKKACRYEPPPATRESDCVDLVNCRVHVGEYKGFFPIPFHAACLTINV